jgi:hypothetical protein
MSQNTRLLKHLRNNPTTQRHALIDLNISSLTRRIADLREDGHKITTVMKRNPVTGQRYAEYRLA